MDEYGIFRGTPQMQPFQLGLVSDLKRATDLMHRMAERIPGSYFVRHMVTREILASVHHTEESLSGANPETGKEPPFDIYHGAPDKNAAWYESVEGLANARARMEQIARIRPGKYFVFSRRDHSILAQIETFPDAQLPMASTSAA
jgi:hypothetical protein